MSTADTSESNSTGALIVLARAPESVGNDEFLRWFKSHLPEILDIPCFVDARLLDLKVFDSPPGVDLPYRYMAIYDYTGDSASAMAAIGEARAAGKMDLPDWFDEFESTHCLISWTGVPA